MNFQKGIYFSLVAIFFVLVGCSQNQLPDDSLRQVPGDISSVTAFNMEQLMEKADMEYIKTLDFYKEGLSEINSDAPFLASLMENPATTGVDLNKNMYMVFDMDKASPNENFVGFVFSIADQSQFEMMLSEMDLGPVEQGTQCNFIAKSRQMVAWNGTVGMIGTGTKHFDSNQIATRFFQDKTDNSLVDNKDLKKCLSGEYDIATWMSSNSIAQNAQVKMAASMVGISHESLNDNYVHAYLNFEEGQINGHSEQFLQKGLTNDLKLFFKDGISKDLSKYIPADNLGLLVGAALDAKGIYQVVSEKIGGYAMANKALKKYGFTSKDIANAFGGDVVVAIYENETNEQLVNKRQKEMPDGLMVSTINNREIFNKFIDLAKEFEMIEMKDDNLYILKNAGIINNKAKKGNQAYLYIKDDLFFVSANQSVMETIQNGGYRSADRVSNDIYNTIGNNAFGSYLNFEKLRHLADEMEEIPFTTAQMDAGLKSSNMQIEMADKSMNSLKAVFKLMNEMYLKNKKETTATEDVI